MKVVSIGGGPAGLYFSILMKRASPRHEITVLERNRPGDTFGFGVVFSDSTLGNLGAEDPDSLAEIRKSFWHWDDIHVFHRGERVVSKGHGFAGLSRQRLLDILEARAIELGVEVRHEVDVEDPTPYLAADLVLAADGVNSRMRTLFAETFKPEIDWRPNRFVWLGTTYPFDAFTFWFEANEHGLWRVHAYRYDETHSTFIVEGTAEAYQKAGFREFDETRTLAYFEELFAHRLNGHRLVANRSLWRQFPTIRNASWHHQNVVLMGDAVHTAHFSIGSGTKLAMEDAIALKDAVIGSTSIPAALESYEATRKPVVESLQRAARVSLEWFENTERYLGLSPNRFAFSLLTRSLRVTHENLRARDPELVSAVDAEVIRDAKIATGRELAPSAPPMFTPLRLRDLVIENRVTVSPMCMYSADDGEIDDFHLVHLGSRAIGGAGLVIAEMTDVSREGRITHGCAGLYRESHGVAWRRVVDFVHEHSAAKIGIQLGHAGRKASTKRPWEGGGPIEGAGAWPTASPTSRPYAANYPLPTELDGPALSQLIDDYRRATRLAQGAGFDLLEVHMAHGYLLSTFLSPLTNDRRDELGGSVENRLRFPVAVLEAVRTEWPSHKPISVRISATEWVPTGTSAGDLLTIAKTLHQKGADIIDVSGGGVVPEQRPPYGRLYQTPFAELIRLELGIPTITVGNISSWADINGVIAAGRADLCALARGHLYDPYWTRHAAQAQGFELPWPPQYQLAKTFKPRAD
ncbi:MAG: FAD-dependent monooxygenase [Deltaproteobacteria bacterium]|nr:FAD-dependent monooxygenase [Deltaproteobacteria bacterium]